MQNGIRLRLLFLQQQNPYKKLTKLNSKFNRKNKTNLINFRAENRLNWLN
jgi:hypothetical protein